MKIGVLALQGAFIEHIQVFRRLEVDCAAVRLPAQLDEIDGLVIPGGESTTMMNLLETFNLIQPLRKKIKQGLPVLGTCAGMICLAKKVFNPAGTRMETLGVMDIQVKRNAFGRQVDSFETELAIKELGKHSFHAVFIRAPYIEKILDGVKVLARLPDGEIVAAQQDNLLVTSFHPELTEDLRLHTYFLKIISY